MDYVDYRERLGIGLNDIEKQDLFFARIKVIFQAGTEYKFDVEDERVLCYEMGIPCERDKPLKALDLSAGVFEARAKGLQKAWSYLEKYKGDFKEFLIALVILANKYSGLQEEKKEIYDSIKKALKDSHIQFDIIKDDEGVFIFPKGAKELDDALVSEPLEWLNDYPNTRKTYVTALKQYSDGEYIRDTADNFRKALEEFLREFLNNNDDMNVNKKNVEVYLKDRNANGNLVAMVTSLISHYYLMNNVTAKHKDDIDKKYLEYIMYQTGVVIRMLIVVKKSSEEEQTNAD